MKTVAIPLSLMQDIFRHLASRPWAEANDLIVGLQRCLPAPEPDAPPTPENTKPKGSKRA